MMTKTKHVDVHSHALPKEMLDAIRRRPRDHQMRIQEQDGNQLFVRDDGHSAPIFAEFYDADAKVESMDRKGIDISIISPTPFIFFYWLDADVALAAAHITNDGIARIVAARPDRLRGMATLPMQNPDAAVTELERVAKEYGFRAVEVGCTIDGRQLADPRFRPVLKRAQELGVFVFTHPHFPGGMGAELGCYFLSNLIGYPLDTVVMAAYLMFSGTLDELPGLKIVLAHGGGYLPYQIGRLARGHLVSKDARKRSPTSPLELVRRFYYDALTHDAAALRFLIERVGADRVMIGTDAPYEMGERNPLAMLDALPGLTGEQRERILGLNALGLLCEQ